MSLEMRGSMLLWITLIPTMNFTTRWRVVVLLLGAFYFYCARDLALLFLFYSGALLADLSLAMGSTATLKSPSSPTFQRSRVCTKQIIKRYWPIVTAIIGLFLGCLPERNPDRQWWSRTLTEYGKAFFPEVGMPLNFHH
jgi:hypothetical protein